MPLEDLLSTKESATPRQHIKPHRFKRGEWRYINKKSDLIALLREYKREFQVVVWNKNIISHFLELYHFLYPGEYPKWHHFRAIYTILEEVDL